MFTSRAILAIAIALSVQNTTLAEKGTKKADTPPPKKEQKVERRSVSARVESAVGRGTGIRAEKAPGEFTIPKGMTATNFKYRFHDPKSKIKLDKLTESSIYSITEKRYISEATNGPDFELPPGKYKFVVGGRPGAYGSLSFDVAPGKVTPEAVDHELPKKFDVSYHDQGEAVFIPKDNPFVLHFADGDVSAKWVKSETYTYPESPITTVFRTEISIDGRFEKGRLTGKVTHYWTHTNSGGDASQNGTIWKVWQYGQATGHANQSGQLTVVLHYTDLKHLGRHTDGAWHDHTDEVKNAPYPWKPSKHEMVFQLPVKKSGK